MTAPVRVVLDLAGVPHVATCDGHQRARRVLTLHLRAGWPTGWTIQSPHPRLDRALRQVVADAVRPRRAPAVVEPEPVERVRLFDAPGDTKTSADRALIWIIGCFDQFGSPTHREVAAGLGVSKTRAAQVIAQLLERGLLAQGAPHLARTLHPTKAGRRHAAGWMPFVVFAPLPVRAEVRGPSEVLRG